MAQPKTYTVSQVTDYIKSVFDSDYLLPKITVSGEVWECKYHGVGHIYFTIKDDAAQLSCVMFAKSQKGLDFEIKPGQKIDVSGSVSVYKASGKYQLYAQSVSLSGQGDLYARFLALKERLFQTGMFDPVYKKPIPKYIKRLGVVTSADGAALQDIIRVTKRRNNAVEIIVSPASVQGEGAPKSLIAALLALEDKGADVVIIGRGGGSAEDLWAFNDEALAQAIFDYETPVISAIGHETDFTIADFVADLRAPTPSAAAEMAVFESAALLKNVNALRDNLNTLMQQKIISAAASIERRKLLLEARNPATAALLARQRLSGYMEGLNNDIKRCLLHYRYKIGSYGERLNGVSPLNTLNRGFAFVTNIDEKAIKSSGQVNIGEVINIRLADGKISAAVQSKQ